MKISYIRSEKEIKRARNLGLSNRGKKLSEEHKKKIGLGVKGRVDSIETRKKSMGPGNGRWKGGSSKPMAQFKKTIRELPEYIAWRKAIFNRDDYTCVRCGENKVDIQADHHPILFSEILKNEKITTLVQAIQCELLWDIKNGRTLCIPCHRHITYHRV